MDARTVGGPLGALPFGALGHCVQRPERPVGETARIDAWPAPSWVSRPSRGAGNMNGVSWLSQPQYCTQLSPAHSCAPVAGSPE